MCAGSPPHFFTEWQIIFQKREFIRKVIDCSFYQKAIDSAADEFRHISNAKLYHDNVGLESGIFLAGFSYFLPQH